MNGERDLKPDNYGLPTVKLTQTPTMLEEAPRFAALLGGPRIFIKRDDTTSLAMGGNKARKLEFLMGDAVSLGCDYVITCGGPQSNHARLTAAAARKCGMQPVLVLDGEDPGHRMGNLLLDTLLGAELVFTGDRPAMAVMEEVKARLEGVGRRPYVIPLGGSNALGTLGYVKCAYEIIETFGEMDIDPRTVYVAAGSMGTYAGLLLGKLLASAEFDVVGVGVSPDEESKASRSVELVLAAQAFTGGPTIAEDDVRPHIKVLGGFVGQGYGIPTKACLEAVHLLAETEGILADPVYTGKALSALVSHIRQGVYTQHDAVVFLHTGGAPADFAYSEAFIK